MTESALQRSEMVEVVRLEAGDAVTKLRELSDGSVDLIITDPAYESLEKHRKRGTTTRLAHSKKSSNDWFKIFPNRRFPELLMEMYRVLRKNSHLYIFCDDETSNVLWYVNRQLPQPFKWWKRIVWDKEAMGMGYHWRARYEFIVFLEKGKRKLNNLGLPDVLRARRIRGGYPAQKPVDDLLDRLVENSSAIDEVVCDPFMGSGSTGIAALNAGRRFVGFDIAEGAIEIAGARIKEVVGQ